MEKKKNAKDTTSNLFNRYVWLVDIISRKEKITLAEINNEWQRASLNMTGESFPTRTFHNHCKAIEQMFDINIACDKQDGHKYYIESNDKSEYRKVRDWLLNLFAINNLINESHKLKPRILFEKIPSGQKFLTPIIEAMRDGRSLEITYQTFWKDAPYTIEIYPYCIKVFKQRWYVIAYNPMKERILTYALDRIKNISFTHQVFQLPKDFDGESFFFDCFGIVSGEGRTAENVLIKVNKIQDSYIRALPLHHSQKEVKNTPEYALFSYHIIPSIDFRQELLSHGSDVEVLEPKWFREEIAAIISAQHDVYTNSKDSP